MQVKLNPVLPYTNFNRDNANITNAISPSRLDLNSREKANFKEVVKIVENHRPYFDLREFKHGTPEYITMSLMEVLNFTTWEDLVIAWGTVKTNEKIKLALVENMVATLITRNPTGLTDAVKAINNVYREDLFKDWYDLEGNTLLQLLINVYTLAWEGSTVIDSKGVFGAMFCSGGHLNTFRTDVLCDYKTRIFFKQLTISKLLRIHNKIKKEGMYTVILSYEDPTNMSALQIADLLDTGKILAYVEPE